MSAGQMLNAARTARGMSLEDLAQITKLRASILAAMEDDDFSHCGGRCTPGASCARWPRSSGSIPTTWWTRSTADWASARPTDRAQLRSLGRCPTPRGKVAVVTLGCARNEVDSEEMAGRLAAGGWELVDDPEDADAVLVNTCGFVEVAKKDSIDAILAVADLKDGARGPRAVVAVGCLAERYGSELADSLPGGRRGPGLRRLPRHRRDAAPHRGRRAARAACAHRPPPAAADLARRPTRRGHAVVPGHGAGVERPVSGPGWQPPVLRRRLDGSPVAPVKLASGCDRRCTFCAIPSFRGSFVSRPPLDVVAEIAWLVEQGVREVVLVSENSTSYGKDLGDLRLLEALLPRIAADTDDRARARGLPPAGRGAPRPARRHRQVAGRRPLLRPVLPARQSDGAATHAPVRRPRGVPRPHRPHPRPRPRRPASAATSSSGFPGETQEEFDELLAFLEEARLDAVGVFGYSDEDGTEAATLPGQARRGRHPRAGRAGDRAGRRGDGAAGRGPHRPAGRGPGRGARRRRRRAQPVAVGRAGSSGARRRRHDRPHRRRRRRRGRPGRRRWSSTSRASTSWPSSSSRRVKPAVPDRAADPVGDAPLVNLPNALTVLRVLCVPLLAVLLAVDGGEQRHRPRCGRDRLRAGVDHRPHGRRDRPPLRHGHDLREDRRPDRRQGAHRASPSSGCPCSATCPGG